MHASRRVVLCAAIALATVGVVAETSAQAPAKRIRGEIESVTDNAMTVRTRSGDTVSLKLADKVSVTQVVPSSMAAIKAGSYIGTAAVPQPDGTLKALEVQVFPEAMRGVGEGHQPWDLTANSTMTNGTVGSVREASGRHIVVDYKGGEQNVFVPPDVPVITFEPGNRSMLQPRSHVLASATEAADGGLTAVRVSVGKDGLVPPM